MNSAIEAMARAMMRADGAPVDPSVEDMLPMATAALTALAENITPEMWAAGSDAMGDTGDPSEVLRAMCAAAVKGEG